MGFEIAVIAFIIYVLAVLFIIGLLLLTIVFFLLPPITQNFLNLIELYYKNDFIKAIKKHSIHLLIFFPIFSLIIYLAIKLNATILVLISLILFLGSAFVGFYIFLFFLYSAYYKSWKRVFVALFLGAMVFVPFAPSGYFLFEPIYKAWSKKKIVKNNQNSTKEKNIKNSVDIFSDIQINSTMSAGEKERIKRFKELENSRSYNL